MNSVILSFLILFFSQLAYSNLEIVNERLERNLSFAIKNQLIVGASLGITEGKNTIKRDYGSVELGTEVSPSSMYKGRFTTNYEEDGKARTLEFIIGHRSSYLYYIMPGQENGRLEALDDSKFIIRLPKDSEGNEQSAYFSFDEIVGGKAQTLKFKQRKFELELNRE